MDRPTSTLTEQQRTGCTFALAALIVTWVFFGLGVGLGWIIWG